MKTLKPNFEKIEDRNKVLLGFINRILIETEKRVNKLSKEVKNKDELSILVAGDLLTIEPIAQRIFDLKKVIKTNSFKIVNYVYKDST